MKFFLFATFVLITFLSSSQTVTQTFNSYDNNPLKYSNRTLNYLLGNYIGGYISSIEIPSTRSVYAVMDESDKSLSLGFVLNDLWKPKDYDFHRWQAQLALKSKGNGKDKFYTFRKDDDFVKSIGLELTNTINFRGALKGDQNFRDKVDLFRDAQILNNVNDLVSKGLKSDATTVNNKIAELEGKNIIESGHYSFFHKGWINVKAYLPLTPIRYEITESADSINVNKVDFKNWSFSLSGNYFLQTKKYGAHLFTLKAGIINNNYILNDSISSKDFYTLNSLSGGMPVLGEQNSYYVGNYKEFTSLNIGASWSSLFLFNKSLGLSAKIETNIDDNDNSLNWTLGIPFALRGKDSDTPVSFEVQWKEVNKTHLLGISVGLAFGEKK